MWAATTASETFAARQRSFSFTAGTGKGLLQHP
jgi:hypothetical protein